VIGGGKTGMDACLWLLDHGMEADRIYWIIPRDAWWMDRAKLQFTSEYFDESIGFMTDQMEVLSEAQSVDDLCERFEARNVSFRIDPTVKPTMSGTIGELHARQIKTVVRGRVGSISKGEMRLDYGSVTMPADTLYIDCSARGIPQKPTVTIFEGTRITLQWVKAVRPTFSAALIGYVAAHYQDNDRKRQLCTPMSPPREPFDWLRMLAISLENHKQWAGEPELQRWIVALRLDPATSLPGLVSDDDGSAKALLVRYRQAAQAGAANLATLLEAARS